MLAGREPGRDALAVAGGGVTPAAACKGAAVLAIGGLLAGAGRLLGLSPRSLLLELLLLLLRRLRPAASPLMLSGELLYLPPLLSGDLLLLYLPLPRAALLPLLSGDLLSLLRLLLLPVALKRLLPLASGDLLFLPPLP